MRILAVSDSHGDIAALREMAEKEKPDVILHMGDCVSDATELGRLTGIPIMYVSGNNDYASNAPEDLEVELKGKNILILHGHTRAVHLGKGRILSFAKAKQADIVFFGHTHKAYEDCIDGVHLINPGQASRRAGRGTPGSYAVVLLTQESMKVEFYRL